MINDANGNQTTRTIGNDVYTLSYDAENRLVSVSGPSLNATFTYDGDGARVMSEINNVTTRFVGNYYQVTDSAVTKYYYAGASRIAMRKDGTLSYLLSDHLGSTSITTDSSGNKVSEMRYTAWGEVRYESGTTPTEYTYTGQYSYTVDFGLMYYNARWYDPALGRFAQADTLIPGAGDSQAWDRYAYANNNPVRYVDPSGHAACGGLDDEECRTPLVENLAHSERKRTTNEKDGGNCEGLECANSNNNVGEDIALSTNNPSDPLPPELSTGEKIGLTLTGFFMVAGFTVAEISLGIVGLALLFEAGPVGVVAELALIVPAELLLIDVEIGVANYIYNVVSSGTRKGHQPEFILIPKIKQWFDK